MCVFFLKMTDVVMQVIFLDHFTMHINIKTENMDDNFQKEYVDILLIHMLFNDFSN